MFGSIVRPLINRVTRTFEAAGPVAGGREVKFLFDDPITHPEGDEVFARFTRETVYPADLQKAA